MKIIETLQKIQKFRFTGPVSKEEIDAAESRLSLKFAEEYVAILRNYGSILLKGEEFFGIDDNSYDLVQATLEAHSENPKFPSNVYVIENMGIDGILLVQNNRGEIFTYQSGQSLKKVYDSLNDYILSLE